jgi:hypothetical protein
MLTYTDIAQNTYVQSCTVTEIMAREKCGLLSVPRTIPISRQMFWMSNKPAHRTHYIQGVPGGMCQTSGGCSLC